MFEGYYNLNIVVINSNLSKCLICKNGPSIIYTRVNIRYML